MTRAACDRDRAGSSLRASARRPSTRSCSRPVLQQGGGHLRVTVGVGVTGHDLELGPQRGQRAPQFMRGVGDEAALCDGCFVEAGEHVVEGDAQRLDLVLTSGQVQAAVQIGRGDVRGLAAQCFHRAQSAAGRERDRPRHQRRQRGDTDHQAGGQAGQGVLGLGQGHRHDDGGGPVPDTGWPGQYAEVPSVADLEVVEGRGMARETCGGRGFGNPLGLPGRVS